MKMIKLLFKRIKLYTLYKKDGTVYDIEIERVD